MIDDWRKHYFLAKDSKRKHKVMEPFIVAAPKTLAEAKQRVTELEQHIAQFRETNRIVFVDGVLVCLSNDIRKVPGILDEHARLLHLLDITGAWLHREWEV